VTSTTRARTISMAAFAVVLSVSCLALPVGAFAVAASVAASPAVIVTATPLGTWALDFTLPTFGKSGCMVCHGDPNLVVPSGARDVSFWIDQGAYDKSSHARVVCTGCHSDFGYKAPHDKSDWRAVAKQSCSNCHDQANRDFLAGTHALRPGSDKSPDPKAANKPLCGDCHGAHEIAILKDNPAGRAALRAAAEKTCGLAGCHKDYWDNYSDYYHGAAYKAGTADAPTCWDCHGYHTVIPSSDKASPTNPQNLAATCGKGANGKLDGTSGLPSCHEGPDGAGYATYAKLIHRKAEVVSANPIYSFIATVRSWFGK
jgi:hypothetical protein